MIPLTPLYCFPIKAQPRVSYGFIIEVLHSLFYLGEAGHNL